MDIDKEKLKKVLLWLGFALCVLTGIIVGMFWFYSDDLPPQQS